MDMKITITIPDSVYAKLERDRGSVPRSTYLQDLVMGVSTTGRAIHLGGGDIKQGGTMPEPKKEDIKVDEEEPVKEKVLKDLEDRGFVSKGFSKADQLNWKHVKK